MADIVERLRKGVITNGLMLEAADEIERLTAQLAIAMDALRRINAKTEENIVAMKQALNIHKRGDSDG